MSRLDQILGKQGSKAKDVYASKISLASRVVKVERSVSVPLHSSCTHLFLSHLLNCKLINGLLCVFYSNV